MSDLETRLARLLKKGDKEDAMAFKSAAQRRKMKELVEQGRLTPEKYAEMEKGTPDNLPERIHPSKEEGK